MPKVGDKKFKYTKAGKKAAKAYAKKKGLPVSNAMERKQAQYGLAAICIGGGEASAVILERL